MKMTFPRVAPIAIVVGSLSAEVVLQPDLSNEQCGDYVATALCHRPGLEPWNFHTTHDEVEEVPIAWNTWVASGNVNSMTTLRGLFSTDDQVLRFNPRGHFTIGGIEI